MGYVDITTHLQVIQHHCGLVSCKPDCAQITFCPAFCSLLTLPAAMLKSATTTCVDVSAAFRAYRPHSGTTPRPRGGRWLDIRGTGLGPGAARAAGRERHNMSICAEGDVAKPLGASLALCIATRTKVAVQRRSAPVSALNLQVSQSVATLWSRYPVVLETAVYCNGARRGCGRA
jgi:hypothetical protein